MNLDDSLITTSKSARGFKFSRTTRLLAAVFVVALAACAPGAGSLGGGCLVCSAPADVNLEEA